MLAQINRSDLGGEISHLPWESASRARKRERARRPARVSASRYHHAVADRTIYFQLRIDSEEWHSNVVAAAGEDRRSINSEILWLVELGLKAREQAHRLDAAADEHLLDRPE